MIQLLVFIAILVATKCCPDACNCVPAIQRTVCKARNITRIPKGIPPYTVLLSITDTNLSHIEASDFDGLPNLKGLVIMKTQLSTLFVSVLEKLKGLVMLGVGNNMLTQVPKFPPNMALKSLNLQNNLLNRIDNQHFSELTSLKFLYLDHNNIQHIGIGSFENLRNLSKLSLKNNSIHSLEKGSFSCLQSLRTLSLNKNKLTFLPEELFDGLGNLQTLLINSNELTRIARMSFAPLVKVKRIELLHNKLIFIHQDTFLHQAELRFLYMYGNLLPCSCNFLSHLRKKSVYIFADYFDHGQPTVNAQNKSIVSKEWGSWSNTHCKKSCSSAITTKIRVRLCLDCSKKKYPSFSSFNTNIENSTCIFVQGRNNDQPNAITSCNPWANCSDTCNILLENSASIMFATRIFLGTCGVTLFLFFSVRFCSRRARSSEDLCDLPPHGANDPENSPDTSKSGAESPNIDNRAFTPSTNSTE